MSKKINKNKGPKKVKTEFSYMEVLNDFRRGFLIKSLLTDKVYKYHSELKIVCELEGLCFYPLYEGISDEELNGTWISLGTKVI